MNQSKKVCCIKGCKKTSDSIPKVTFYSFPCQSVHSPWKSEKRTKWIRAIQKNTSCGRNWQPSKNSKICSAHFYGNKKSEHPLHPSYLPQIFPGENKEKKLKNQMMRFLRKQKRDQNQLISCTKKIKDMNEFQHEQKQNKRRLTLSTTEIMDVDESNVAENNMKIQSSNTNFDDFSCQTDEFLMEYVESCDSYDSCIRIIDGKSCEVSIQIHIKNYKRMQDQATCVNIRPGISVKDASTDATDLQDLQCTGFHGITSIKTNKAMISLAGVSFSLFYYLLYILPNKRRYKMDKKNRLLLFLIKMKLGVSFSALGNLFGIHRITSKRIFFYTLEFLRVVLKNAISWPSKQMIKVTLPDSFKDHYRNTRVIIHCTEIRTQIPKSVSAQVLMYSNYKHCHTVKFLVGCTPNGFISFVSDCYGGRSGDCAITVDSGLIDLLEPGDIVLADRGFPNIQTALEDKEAVLVMPPFANEPQFTPEEVQQTYNIASVRIHIERIIQRIKEFNIFKNLSTNLLPDIDNIVYVACALINLQKPIIQGTGMEEND